MALSLLALAASAVVAATAPLAARAQDIAVAYDRIPLGTSYDYENSDGQVVRLSIMGETDGGWLEIWETLSPERPDLAERWITDAGSNALSVEYAYGASFSFAPHSCRRVVGSCEFTVTGPLSAQRYLHVTTLSPNGFTATLYRITDTGDQEFYLESKVILDADGVVVEAKRRYANGATYAYWRIDTGTG